MRVAVGILRVSVCLEVWAFPAVLYDLQKSPQSQFSGALRWKKKKITSLSKMDSLPKPRPCNYNLRCQGKIYRTKSGAQVRIVRG